MSKIIEVTIFTKIFNKLEYAESFLEGNIRFNPLRDYVLIEDGRKDSREGLKFNLQSNKTKVVFRIGNKSILIPNLSGSIKYSSDRILEKKCLCLTMNKYTIDLEKNELSFQGITEEEINKFGEYIVIILNPEKFINKISSYFDKENIFFENRNVEYKDFSKFHGEIKNEGFVKDIKYKTENEYRILADINQEGIKTINIGSLRDIALRVSYEEFKKLELIIR